SPMRSKQESSRSSRPCMTSSPAESTSSRDAHPPASNSPGNQMPSPPAVVGDVDRRIGEVAGDERWKELAEAVGEHPLVAREQLVERPPAMTLERQGLECFERRGPVVVAGFAPRDVEELVLIEVQPGEGEVGVLGPHARADLRVGDAGLL